MELRLYLPQYNELLFREQLLADPETMAFNRFKEPMEDYHPDTGCIDFPRNTWALWYDFCEVFLQSCKTERGEIPIETEKTRLKRCALDAGMDAR
jgi:hypothetical protein